MKCHICGGDVPSDQKHHRPKQCIPNLEDTITELKRQKTALKTSVHAFLATNGRSENEIKLYFGNMGIPS